MDTLITDQVELRARGFRALVDALGWVNAVEFLRQYERGSGNYTEERRTLLPDRDAATLIRKVKELQDGQSKGALRPRAAGLLRTPPYRG